MRTVFVWAVILIPLVILAVYIGESLDSDTAALAMGAILGLMGAGLAALITIMVRELRHDRQREEARRGWRVESARPADARPGVVDGEWREVASGSHPRMDTNTRMLPEAEQRALTVRR